MLIFTEEKLLVRWNIFIINNTKLTIITDPIRVIGFFRDADFTNYVHYLPLPILHSPLILRFILILDTF